MLYHDTIRVFNLAWLAVLTCTAYLVYKYSVGFETVSNILADFQYTCSVCLNTLRIFCKSYGGYFVV